ncbi:MAG: HEAT repeat domain-containing protein [Chloroflexi bacterium]|nr:HEAT repeat domain-containing protein [Chloroflexota bacterium]
MPTDLRYADEDSLAKIATSDLLAALEGSDPEVRSLAIYALGQRRESTAVTALIACLADPGSFIARTAADALEHIGSPALPALVQALAHPDAQTRGLAARALARLKDPAAIPALFKALDDESAVVRHWADDGLDRMGVGQIYFKP